MKPKGNPNSPTPPNNTNKNIPKKVIQAIKNTTNETSKASSMSLQTYWAPVAVLNDEVLEVAVVMDLEQAVTGISALLKDMYRMKIVIMQTAKVQKDIYAAPQILSVMVLSSSVS